MLPLSRPNPNAEKLVCAYLSPFFENVASHRWVDAPTPFILVKRLPGGGQGEVSDCALMSIKVFGKDVDEAGDLADEVHERMRKWKPKDTVSYGGHSFGINLLEVEDAPFWLDYGDDTEECYTARYWVHLRVDYV
ncbi:head-tail adaptor [Mycobacterium phage SirDuracell]|uniref:Tail terminator n=22 Tax=Viruses TaxID=10239 RepID=Q857Z4_9CAUD|nr:head-tail adaptor [Mycobacterium phage Cjw1]YP_002014337.1 head-tail adaptor [Mycobacterium phage Porky]YP_002014486.1 head-tail adaptor [Mycobacterium phage Kostya]YP_008051496.1 head-tail adaptor [Mycobacterium phage Murphy]YP_008051642.1 head-tail adaptor [Mycobacterium phage Dumbo]YP_008051953.1 head-tail adaptor [Mycobacterium phage Phrux]YP_008052190.1 head-tail adaptor [Mycobacterium phage Phaux]YP_008409411.1 head-tail adaptor [Mycobacterium phage DrDrey]YP_008410035.1 head-tail 